MSVIDVVVVVDGTLIWNNTLWSYGRFITYNITFKWTWIQHSLDTPHSIGHTYMRGYLDETACYTYKQLQQKKQRKYKNRNIINFIPLQ